MFLKPFIKQTFFFNHDSNSLKGLSRYLFYECFLSLISLLIQHIISMPKTCKVNKDEESIVTKLFYKKFLTWRLDISKLLNKCQITNLELVKSISINKT